jgi:hypothetical protein
MIVFAEVFFCHDQSLPCVFVNITALIAYFLPPFNDLQIIRLLVSLLQASLPLEIEVKVNKRRLGYYLRLAHACLGSKLACGFAVFRG